MKTPPTSDESPWLYEGTVVDELPADAFAFVYMVTNKLSGRRYIGKKLATRAKTRVVKGKRKRSRVESDWRGYWGSCDELREEVAAIGARHFKREILVYCRSRGWASWHETRLQMVHDVLNPDSNFYNAFVGCRIHRNHLFPPKKVDTEPTRV